MASGTVEAGLKSSKSPLPPVLDFDAHSCTSDELVEALKVSGGVVVRNLLTTEELREIETDVRPWLDKDKPWDGDFFPPETRRATGLLGKSKTFGVKLVGHKLWLEVCDALLTSELAKNWVSSRGFLSIVRFVAQRLTLMAGGRRQDGT